MKRILHLFFLLFIFVNTTAFCEKKVVIVPDEETFLYYLGRWSPSEKFPIFIGESKYSQKFISAYKPDVVEKAGKKNIGGVNIDNIFRALAASLTGKNMKDIISGEGFKLYYKTLCSGKPVDGVVITGRDSKELMAGAALASFYRQDVFMFDYGRTMDDKLTFDEVDSLRNSVLQFIRDRGYKYSGRSGIEYITIARDLPYIYERSMSVDDAMGREKMTDSDVYAFVGRLVEVEEGASLYQAMCSLFLEAEKSLFFDLWSPDWKLQAGYGAWMLFDRMPTLNISGPQAGVGYWRSLVRNGLPANFIWVNTGGGPKDWGGTGSPDDIPSCSPCCVYFAHSNSARDPRDKDTICGRWLSQGAYFYVGSVFEPYAQSFQFSYYAVKDLLDGRSFARAFQTKRGLFKGRFDIPWKHIYIGNPRSRLVIGADAGEQYIRFKEIFLEIKRGNFYSAKDMLEKSISGFSDPYIILESENFLKEVYLFDFCRGVDPSMELAGETGIEQWMLNLSPDVIRRKNRVLSEKGDMFIFYLKNRYYSVDDAAVKRMISAQIHETEDYLQYVKDICVFGPFQDISSAQTCLPGIDNMMRIAAPYDIWGRKVILPAESKVYILKSDIYSDKACAAKIKIEGNAMLKLLYVSNSPSADNSAFYLKKGKNRVCFLVETPENKEKAGFGCVISDSEGGYLPGLKYSAAK
ncbi:MAG: hypothetical protein JW728_02595 [Candidatus Aureabacteria bacterium]|nr:hypothetical protein [Candidatus Auribacterota bacterium]